MRISTEVRREQLIKAAITVLMREGVEKASLRTIAQEANASLAAVHVCFEDKDDLMNIAMGEFLRQLTVTVSGRAVLQRGLREAARKVLQGFWKTTIAEPHYALAQFEIGVWSLRNTGHEKVIKMIYENYEQQIVEILAKSQRLSGETPTISLAKLARGLVVIIDGCVLQYMADPKNSDARELSEMLLDSVFDRAGV